MVALRCQYQGLRNWWGCCCGCCGSWGRR